MLVTDIFEAKSYKGKNLVQTLQKRRAELKRNAAARIAHREFSGGDPSSHYDDNEIKDIVKSL